MLEKCKQVLNEKAELIVKAFQPPANHSDIDELEHLIGGNLPDEFKALYFTHDGFGEEHFANLFYGFPFLSLKKIKSKLIELNGENDSLKLRFSDSGIKPGYTRGRK